MDPKYSRECQIRATRSSEDKGSKNSAAARPREHPARIVDASEQSPPLSDTCRKKKGGGHNHRVLRTKRVTVGTADVILVLLGPHPKLEAASNNFACTGLAPRSRDSAM